MENTQYNIYDRRVVLLADDDDGDQELISRAFKTSGLPCELWIVADGGQAIDFLRRNGPFATAPRPDLVLLDLNMPRVSGREVLQQVKADKPDLILCDWNMPNMTGPEFLQALTDEGIDTIFGFVTTETTQEMKDKATEMGARFLISKPFTPDSFKATLGAHIS